MTFGREIRPSGFCPNRTFGNYGAAIASKAAVVVRKDRGSSYDNRIITNYKNCLVA